MEGSQITVKKIKLKTGFFQRSISQDRLLFKFKDSYLGANLTELLHSSVDFVRIASLCR